MLIHHPIGGSSVRFTTSSKALRRPTPEEEKLWRRSANTTGRPVGSSYPTLLGRYRARHRGRPEAATARQPAHGRRPHHRVAARRSACGRNRDRPSAGRGRRAQGLGQRGRRREAAGRAVAARLRRPRLDLLRRRGARPPLESSADLPPIVPVLTDDSGSVSCTGEGAQSWRNRCCGGVPARG